MMPGSTIFAIMFFLMLLALGIDSAFSMVEALNTAWLEALEPPGSPPKKAEPAFLTAAKRVPPEHVPRYLCVAGWFFGIIFCTDAGYYWLDVCNKYIIFTLTLVGCIECVAITWVREGQGKFLSGDIESMIGKTVHPGWRFVWKYICPPILGLLFLTSMASEFWNMGDIDLPAPVIVFGWMLGLLPTCAFTYYFLAAEPLPEGGADGGGGAPAAANNLPMGTV
jgi:hypothetical protein